MIGLILLLCMPLSKSEAHLTFDRARQIIGEEYPFPRPVFTLIHLPPHESNERRILDHLVRSKIIVTSNKEEFSIGHGVADSIQILRNYPSYRTYGIQLNSCKINYEIKQITSKRSGVYEVEGKSVIERTPLLQMVNEEIQDLLLEKCRPRPLKWTISKSKGQFHVEELNGHSL